MFGRFAWRCLPGISSFCAVGLLAAALLAGEPQKIDLSSTLPYGPPPINYFSESEPDLITELQTRLNDGTAVLRARPDSGYLLDFLHSLKIPVESQSLVFSKTSVNQALIRPASPRAIYFSDDVTVGWVPGAASLEITVQDPLKGTIFYTLPQPIDGEPAGDRPALRFHRDGRCTACHVSSRTLNVPGHILGSFLTDSRGQPREGYSPVTHATEFPKRWGGWYVTGRAPDLVHWGNLIGAADSQRHKQDPAFRGALCDLAPLVDLARYPSPHSDAVALLVLNHQMHFYNLVNRVSFESKLNRRSDAEDHLVRYALMQDEAPLAGPVAGSSRFAEIYQEGPQDDPLRALRQLDLSTRLFRHSLSPLVASRSFRLLPDDVKARLYERLDAELALRPDPTALKLLRAVR